MYTDWLQLLIRIIGFWQACLETDWPRVLLSWSIVFNSTAPRRSPLQSTNEDRVLEQRSRPCVSLSHCTTANLCRVSLWCTTVTFSLSLTSAAIQPPPRLSPRTPNLLMLLIRDCWIWEYKWTPPPSLCFILFHLLVFFFFFFCSSFVYLALPGDRGSFASL